MFWHICALTSDHCINLYKHLAQLFQQGKNYCRTALLVCNSINESTIAKVYIKKIE